MAVYKSFDGTKKDTPDVASGVNTIATGISSGINVGVKAFEKVAEERRTEKVMSLVPPYVYLQSMYSRAEMIYFSHELSREAAAKGTPYAEDDTARLLDDTRAKVEQFRENPDPKDTFAVAQQFNNLFQEGPYSKELSAVLRTHPNNPDVGKFSSEFTSRLDSACKEMTENPRMYWERDLEILKEDEDFAITLEACQSTGNENYLQHAGDTAIKYGALSNAYANAYVFSERLKGNYVSTESILNSTAFANHVKAETNLSRLADEMALDSQNLLKIAKDYIHSEEYQAKQLGEPLAPPNPDESIGAPRPEPEKPTNEPGYNNNEGPKTHKEPAPMTLPETTPPEYVREEEQTPVPCTIEDIYGKKTAKFLEKANATLNTDNITKSHPSKANEGLNIVD